MNANQPNIKPLEPVSFDDLQPEAPEAPVKPEHGIPGVEPLEADLPVPEGGSLKDRIIAQAKQEEAQVAAVEAAKEEVTLEQPIEVPVQPATPEVVPAAPVEPPAAAVPEPAPKVEPPVVPETKPAALPDLPPVPEAPVAAEAKPEVAVEAQPTETEQPKPSKPQAQDQPAMPPPAATPVQAQPEKTETRMQIESILQEGLAPMFLQMNPQERLAFAQAANETASKLEVLVTQFKASAKEVLRLIKAWLKKIPQVNKYFLEQSSKIKTDEILLVQAQKRKESRLLH